MEYLRMGVLRLLNGSCFRLAFATTQEASYATTTQGTGELIKAALEAGCEKLIIGIGAVPPMTAGLAWHSPWG